jgi:hypothetical protein
MPASPKRRVHLGIDYGTSTSKIVLRDYGARGGEAAFVVLRDGSFRIPSRVCVTANELIFGDDRRSAEECDIYESLKMRVAVEVTGNQKHYFGPPTKLPDGFTAHDLAVLTMWFLISEGHRGIAEYLNGRMEGVSIGMTMGVPMAFFREQQLKASFLAIAKQAWALYRNEEAIGSVLLLEKAHRLLENYRSASATPTPDYEVREWIRSEAEAAMWWPFQSPAIASGPYAKVDIGAGTTHASLFRIVEKNGVKTGLAFFGAVSVSVGMDAVDSAIAESQKLGGDCLSLRGLEESILRTDGKARGALIPVKDEIYEAYRKAWIETYRKINETVAELNAWRTHKVFVIGGGSLVSSLVETNRVHPGLRTLLQLAVLESPADLRHINNTKVSKNELPFVAVAYGLSNIGLSIPEAFTPDQIPPLPDRDGPRLNLDRDDMYAK